MDKYEDDLEPSEYGTCDKNSSDYSVGEGSICDLFENKYMLKFELNKKIESLDLVGAGAVNVSGAFQVSQEGKVVASFHNGGVIYVDEMLRLTGCDSFKNVENQIENLGHGNQAEEGIQNIR